MGGGAWAEICGFAVDFIFGCFLTHTNTHRTLHHTAINEFLDTHKAFEVIRTSGKVVVFDVRISVQLAFYALVEHDMQAAPLWDAR